MSKSPSKSSMRIAYIQEQITNLNYQFSEHIFNDGNPMNCMIEFTLCKQPQHLRKYGIGCEKDDDGVDLQCKFRTGSCVSNPQYDVGWGRFERYEAWTMAWEFFKERHDIKETPTYKGVPI